jgi:hypothetical protein
VRQSKPLAKKKKLGQWIDQIPPEFVLPDSIEAIEAGRPTQGQLLDTQGNSLEELRRKLKQS